MAKLVLSAMFSGLVYSTVFVFTLATSILSQTQKLHDGQTIVSAGNVFELGFFSPNSSSIAPRYVGIWYKQFPGKVVWVANRENPLLDSSGILMVKEFSGASNLAIIDGRSETIWRALDETYNANGTVANLLLSDTGNLVLLDRNGSKLWQSFDHPGDTILPGMKLGLNNQTGENLNISSWRDDIDPSPGTFVARIDAQQPPQVCIWSGSSKHFRSGLWNGMDFIGLRYPIYPMGFTVDANSERGILYISFSSLNYSNPRLLSLDPSGSFALLDWDAGKKVWTQIKKIPDKPCDYYNNCGPFGMCDDEEYNNDPSKMCKCFPGYGPANESEWIEGDWKGGCVRNEKFRCERNINSTSQDIEEDGFLEFPRTKLPDFSPLLYPSADKSSCEALCLKNCSCTGYAFFDTTGCMIWKNELMDIQSYAIGGEKFYLRVSHVVLGKQKRLQSFVILLLIVSSVVFGSSLLALILCLRRTRGRCFMAKVSATGDSHDIRRGNTDVIIFSWKDIGAATKNFDAATKLGEGGFGPVFKGVLSSGQDVAVKRLSRSSGQGVEEFKNEVLLISKLQHRNLVNLIGYCIKEEEKLLVYEYMSNKSLDMFIFGASSAGKSSILAWNMRFHVIEGIARGVLYLHRDSRLRIIHRDLKTSNILLDDEMNPKISDFGMARIFGGNQSTANTNRLVGTYGYMAPEYAFQGIFSEKSDVFSFGVILLEIISARKSTGFHDEQSSITLQDYVWQLWTEGEALQMLDPRLVGSYYDPSQVNRCIQVGLLCVQDNANDRPSMATILHMLTNDMDLPNPKQPLFSTQKHPRGKDSSGNGVISVTYMEGR